MAATPSGVLVVIDGSDTGNRALEVAMDRARDRSVGLTLLAVVPPRLWRAKRAQFQMPQDRRDEEFARAILDLARERCRARGVDVAVRTRSGAPAEIIREESQRGYELLVLGERPNLFGAPSLASIVKDRVTIALEIVHAGNGDPPE